MYKNILVAIDGSDLAEKAMKQAIELAAVIGAKLQILNVTAPWSTLAMGEVAVMFPPQEYEQSVAAGAEALLERARTEAKASGLDAETVHVVDPQPYMAIIDTAKGRGCDLIVMGSHGRRGIAGLLLGSETSKTLTHSSIPVLVYRE